MSNGVNGIEGLTNAGSFTKELDKLNTVQIDGNTMREGQAVQCFRSRRGLTGMIIDFFQAVSKSAAEIWASIKPKAAQSASTWEEEDLTAKQESTPKNSPRPLKEQEFPGSDLLDREDADPETMKVYGYAYLTHICTNFDKGKFLRDKNPFSLVTGNQRDLFPDVLTPAITALGTGNIVSPLERDYKFGETKYKTIDPSTVDKKKAAADCFKVYVDYLHSVFGSSNDEAEAKASQVDQKLCKHIAAGVEIIRNSKLSDDQKAEATDALYKDVMLRTVSPVLYNAKMDDPVTKQNLTNLAKFVQNVANKVNYTSKEAPVKEFASLMTDKQMSELHENLIDFCKALVKRADKGSVAEEIGDGHNALKEWVVARADFLNESSLPGHKKALESFKQNYRKIMEEHHPQMMQS